MAYFFSRDGLLEVDHTQVFIDHGVSEPRANHPELAKKIVQLRPG
ncbi:hypothetical protein [Glutamicibacter ardleyensis]